MVDHRPEVGTLFLAVLHLLRNGDEVGGVVDRGDKLADGHGYGTEPELFKSIKETAASAGKVEVGEAVKLSLRCISQQREILPVKPERTQVGDVVNGEHEHGRGQDCRHWNVKEWIAYDPEQVEKYGYLSCFQVAFFLSSTGGYATAFKSVYELCRIFVLAHKYRKIRGLAGAHLSVSKRNRRAGIQHCGNYLRRVLRLLVKVSVGGVLIRFVRVVSFVSVGKNIESCAA